MSRFVSFTIDTVTLLWWRLFQKHPGITSVSTLTVMVGLGLIIYFADQHDQRKQEAIRQRTLDYQTQLTELSRTEANLRNLTEFVQSQKTRLEESEDIISNLKAEQERLKPFVEGDRKVVQAVFDLQAEKNSRGISRERWIGFGLGVLSSIIASFLYAGGSIIWTRYSR